MNILLGITGGIAAYKTPELVRQLIAAGHAVRVVMTQAAREFVTPLTLQTVSGHAIPEHTFDPQFESSMGHIELARWADCVCIAPASADIIARLAFGHANDLLTTLCLATTAPLILAPAMNQQMWQAAITQENIHRLQQRGVLIIGPGVGEQACGEFGPGRMLDPEQIVAEITSQSLPQALLPGKKVVITAGPTREPWDPVRYLSNYSSGKMGFAMAQAALAAGANVILISGPCALTADSKIQRVDVTTAAQMTAAVEGCILDADIFIACAAVADYRVSEVAAQKIKKDQDEITLTLSKNPDILALVAARQSCFTVGFAAETENVLANAQQKRQRKQLDMIIANQVGADGVGFDADDNAVTVIAGDDVIAFDKQNKTQLARQLMKLISEHYCQTKGSQHEYEESTN